MRIGVIDLVAKAPTRALYARVMHANLSSIMPQVVATWCEEEGHDVTFVCYTGLEDLSEVLPEDVDLIFVGAFTEAAQLAYAVSHWFRSRGAVTVIGGPHARCYPEDSRRYFDYVVGFTNRAVIRDILDDCARHRPVGVHISAKEQPTVLPGVRQRWKFIEATLSKSPLLKIVPIIGSLGCPYTCSFCIDSVVPYQPLDFDALKEDLRFLLTKFKRPKVAWHDPNFGIRFNDFMGAIEEAVPPGRISFVAESSLSLLSEPHLKRLQRNGFKAILPGIESWYDHGNKSRTGALKGPDKVHQVVEHVSLILRYIPYIQTNFVLGLDVDEGPEPFDLTAKFLESCPGAFPAYSLLSAFGRAAPLNLEYQRARRVLPFPHHFLNNNHAMNVRPKNYSWPEFYDELIRLMRTTFSWRAIYRRHRATRDFIPRWMNFVRAVSSEGFGRLRYFLEVRRRLDSDPQVRRFFEQETDLIPEFFVDLVRRDLGPLWEWLPKGALEHDPNAYLKSVEEKSRMPLGVSAAADLSSKRAVS